MGKETEKIFKDFSKYVEENSDANRTEADMRNMINEFIAKYNSNLPLKVTPKTAKSSDDYLELAYDADNLNDALKYAKEALKLDPNNFDAEALLIEIKTIGSTKRVRDYAKAVERATAYLEKEGYFEEHCIGAFWGLVETRPYMRLRGKYLNSLIECGMIGQAKEECEELLRLCEGDNLGIRYKLMHILAYFEDEEAAITLHKRFDSFDETQMLLPLSVLYYKKGNYTKATQYLRKLNKVNKDLKRFMKMFISGNDDMFEGYGLDGGYRPGTMEELMIELEENGFFFVGAITYMEWALEQIKKFK